MVPLVRVWNTKLPGNSVLCGSEPIFVPLPGLGCAASLRPDRVRKDGTFETVPACQADPEHLIPSSVFAQNIPVVASWPAECQVLGVGEFEHSRSGNPIQARDNISPITTTRASAWGIFAVTVQAHVSLVRREDNHCVRRNSHSAIATQVAWQMLKWGTKARQLRSSPRGHKRAPRALPRAEPIKCVMDI